MHALPLTLLLLTQAPEAPTPTAEPVESREAAAAERSAKAAERTADALARLAEALTPKAPTAEAPAEKKAQTWVGSVSAGLTFLSGNSQTLTLTGSVAADRKWEVWALGLRASGAYGLTNPSANVEGSVTSTTALRAGGTVRGDRAFGSFASLFVLGGLETDHLKNVEARTYAELGTGLTFFDEKEAGRERLFLRLDLGLRTGYETRYQYFPVEGPVTPYAIVILAPRVAASLRWSPNKDVRLSEELEVIPSLLAPTSGRLLVNSTTKLNARLTESVSLSLSLLVGYDSQPPPAEPRRLSTDVALTAGVEAAF